VLLGVAKELDLAGAPGQVADLAGCRARGYAMTGNRIAIVVDRLQSVVEIHETVREQRGHGWRWDDEKNKTGRHFTKGQSASAAVHGPKGIQRSRWMLGRPRRPISCAAIKVRRAEGQSRSRISADIGSSVITLDRRRKRVGIIIVARNL